MVITFSKDQIVSFEIYFGDLTKKAQHDLLKAFKTDPDDENWDVAPLAIIERELKSTE